MVFTDCESCTRPISTNPGSTEAGEYGLTCGTCFVARRLEVVAVTGLLWISWCVMGEADFFVFFFFNFFFFKRTRPAASMRPPCLIYLSTSSRVGRTHICSQIGFCMGYSRHPLLRGPTIGENGIDNGSQFSAHRFCPLLTTRLPGISYKGSQPTLIRGR